MILAVGYKVNSKRGNEFRKWASKVLKEYLIQGYAVNNKRLEKLNKVIDIQNKMLAQCYRTVSIKYKIYGKILFVV